MDDNPVAQFTEITGSTSELAVQYLELTDYNLEQAMQLYFENGGAEIVEQPSRPQPEMSRSQPSSQPNVYEDATGVVHLDSDDELEEIEGDVVDEIPSSPPARSPTGPHVEDDAAMARRLQEELYAGTESVDGVRAPIARTTETLGPGDGFDDDEIQSAVLNQMRARQSRSSELSQAVS
jgi:UBX domain-containing protein 7